ncbi:hypothetical protein [Candidatus Hodgkinia cicadicola]|uniref:hypothetical protein n=1 Tax=Candidatus Hodgkinia cicadicola TaxID=573658 RepID=UPI001788B925
MNVRCWGEKGWIGLIIHVCCCFMGSSATLLRRWINLGDNWCKVGIRVSMREGRGNVVV